MTIATPTGPGVYRSIQWLRLVAASLVVLCHAFEMTTRIGYKHAVSFHAGGFGVDIFFVISGFLMVVISRYKERAPGDFLYHRILRIGPPYWIVTSLTAMLLMISPSFFHSTRFGFAHYFASMSFVAWPRPGLHTPTPGVEDIWPVYPAGWTMNFEFMFYLLFAGSLFFKGMKALLACAFVLLGLSFLGWIVEWQNPFFRFYTEPVALEFGFGMLLAYAIHKGARLPHAASAISLVLGTVLFALTIAFWNSDRLSVARVIVWGIPAALIVSGAVSLELRGAWPNVPLLRLGGDASYSIYLTHLFVVGIVGRLLRIGSAEKFIPSALAIVLALVASWIFGILFHSYVETPSLKFASSIGRKLRFQAVSHTPISDRAP